jgi:hypothetical protein
MQLITRFGSAEITDQEEIYNIGKVETSKILSEHELEAVLLGVRIPMGPVPVTSVVSFVFYFARGNAKCDGLVWLGSHDKILVSLVGWLSLLLPSTHEPSPRDHALFDLRKMYLDHHTLLSCVHVPYFCDPVAWFTDLEEHFSLNGVLGRCDSQLRVFSILSGSAS